MSTVVADARGANNKTKANAVITAVNRNFNSVLLPGQENGSPT
jgi:hypothetical protein